MMRVDRSKEAEEAQAREVGDKRSKHRSRPMMRVQNTESDTKRKWAVWIPDRVEEREDA